MSGALQSVVSTLQLNNYASVAIIAVIIYDFILTMSDEREYIWKKKWTWVSTLFVIVRYLGCAFVISATLLGSTLVPGPDRVSQGLHYIVDWAYPIFIGATSLVMILRTYAIYGQSRMILGILLVVYITDIVTILATTAIYTRPGALTVATVHVLDYSFCSVTYNIETNWSKYVTIPQFALDFLLCALVVFQFARETYHMYRATQSWQPNRYMSLLAREGVFYFLVNLFYTTCGIVNTSGASIQASRLITISAMSYISVCTLSPRFIISIRKQYARNSLGVLSRGIDTGFGMSFSDGGDMDRTMGIGGDIVFAEAGPTVEVDEIEDVRLVAPRDVVLVEMSKTWA